VALILGPDGEATEPWAERPSGLVVPETYARPWPIGVDLFAGCGGFSLGMHQGGFHVVAAVEMDFAAAITYIVNLARPGVRIHFDTPEREQAFADYLEDHMGLLDGPKAKKKARVVEPTVAGSGWISGQPDSEAGCEHFWIADARTLTGEAILSVLGLKKGDVDCVFGGPPCQGFSYIGKRDQTDPRNSLVFEFVRLVLEIRPKTMCMENVPGLLTMTTPEGFLVVDVICQTLEKGGFGTYDALRRALTGEPGRRVVAEGAGRKRTRKDVRHPKRTLAAELPLFAEAEEPS
jgi:DNA (cytosine-5)-methyltransferase 1